MPDASAAPEAARAPRAIKDQSFAEFVALMALMMALTAFSIDIMLPGFPAVRERFDLADPNEAQLLVYGYMFGFAAGQPVFGPLSDQFGRKPLIFFGLAVYALATVAALVAPTFESLIGARLLQGFGGSAARVIAVAVVRDRYSGRAMAEVMSFVMMVFILAPVVAPALGAAVLAVAGWRANFFFLLLFGAAIAVWSFARLPETLPASARRPQTAGALARAFRRVLTTRSTAGYMLASGFVFGGLMTYVGASEQIFADVYGMPGAFPYLFGGTAAAIAAASLLNARLVERFGMRRLSHWAVATQAGICVIAGLFGFPGEPPLAVAIGFILIYLFCVGIIGPNFNALAMEPMGDIAGVASSALGFFTTAMSATCGAVVAGTFDGSLRPLLVGATLLSLGALATALATENGRFATPGR